MTRTVDIAYSLILFFFYDMLRYRRAERNSFLFLFSFSFVFTLRVAVIFFSLFPLFKSSRLFGMRPFTVTSGPSAPLLIVGFEDNMSLARE